MQRGWPPVRPDISVGRAGNLTAIAGSRVLTHSPHQSAQPGRAPGLQTGKWRMSGSGTAQKNIPADEILVMLCADLRLPHRGCASDYCRVAVDVINHHFPGIRARLCPPLERLAWCLVPSILASMLPRRFAPAYKSANLVGVASSDHLPPQRPGCGIVGQQLGAGQELHGDKKARIKGLRQLK